MVHRKTEYTTTTVRLFSFLVSIVPTSVAVSYASFLGNMYLLAIPLFPCVLTLALSIVPVPVSSGKLIICGALSSVISVSIIIYALAAHPEMLKPYMTLPF